MEIRQETGCGRLVVKQSERAFVYVDGRFVGYSDELSTFAGALELPEGTHEILLVAGRAEPRRLEVAVWAGAASLVLPGLVMTLRS